MSDETPPEAPAVDPRFAHLTGLKGPGPGRPKGMTKLRADARKAAREVKFVFDHGFDDDVEAMDPFKTLDLTRKFYLQQFKGSGNPEMLERAAHYANLQLPYVKARKQAVSVTNEKTEDLSEIAIDLLLEVINQPPPVDAVVTMVTDDTKDECPKE